MGRMLTPSQAKVLGVIYIATDCSNEVYGLRHSTPTQRKIAEAMPSWCVGSTVCVPWTVTGTLAFPQYVEGRIPAYSCRV